MRPFTSVRLLAGVLVLLTACVDGSGPDRGEARTTSGAEGLYGSCGGVQFDQLPPDASQFPAYESWSDVDRTGLGGEASFFEEFVGEYDWFVADRSQDSQMLFGQPRGAEKDPPYAYASLELRDGEWTPVGWGQCRIELAAEGWGNARFVMAGTPDPDSERIAVRATEMACAGGMPPTDRDVRAVVLDENDSAVSIVILVEPSKGGSTCPGNPAFPFEVQLDAPLGQRKFIDASVYPPVVTWPSARPDEATPDAPPTVVPAEALPVPEPSPWPITPDEKRDRATSPEAVLGQERPIKLITHCGIDLRVDFDGSFWQSYNVAKPLKIDNPFQKGTMTLLSDEVAVFRFQGPDGDVSVYFVRNDTPKGEVVCY